MGLFDIAGASFRHLLKHRKVAGPAQQAPARALQHNLTAFHERKLAAEKTSRSPKPPRGSREGKRKDGEYEVRGGPTKHWDYRGEDVGGSVAAFGRRRGQKRSVRVCSAAWVSKSGGRPIVRIV